MDNISPQLKNQISQFQQLQQQLQSVSTQRVQMDAQIREIGRTVEELEKATGNVYKSAGSIMVKVDDKNSVKIELENSKEALEIRIRSLERQEKSLRDRYEEMQETLNKAMSKQS